MRGCGYGKVNLGQLQEFQPESETIAIYLECTSLYFQANSIAEEKQVAVFLSVIGAKNYSLLYRLMAPDRPQDKCYKDLVAHSGNFFSQS